MRRVLTLIGLLLACTLIAALVRIGAHSLAHFFGVANGDGNDPGYLAWSGVLSDLGEGAIITGLIAAYRHHECQAEGCYRLGHPNESGTRTCHAHHPTHPRPRRKMPHMHLTAHHHAVLTHQREHIAALLHGHRTAAEQPPTGE